MDLSSGCNGRPRVLIADDERTIADTLSVILLHNGFEAAAVYDGNQAVDRARIWRPDILLSDVFMPHLGGIEAAIQICAMFPQCRVLLLSANGKATTLRREADHQGHNFEILFKPIPPAELLARLRMIVER